MSCRFAFIPAGDISFEAWRPLWTDYTAGQIPADSDLHAVTCQRLREGSQVQGLVAVEERPLGLAHCYFHPSTWALTPPCYLQDLYVVPAARGRGLGRQLIDEVSRRARAAGSHLLHWNTRADNRAALALYDGIAQRSDRVTFLRPLGAGPG